MKIRGVVVQGHGVASGRNERHRYPEGTIAPQIPHFRALGLDLSACFHGTINLSIAPRTFELAKPRYVFEAVKWSATHRPETFYFEPVEILPVRVSGGRAIAGWIYYPDPSTKAGHFQPPSVLELLAPRIVPLVYGDELEIEVSDQALCINEALSETKARQS